MKLSSAVKGLSKSATVLAGRTGLKLKKYSPEILLVVGITGTIASAVLACRATLKIDDVRCVHDEKLERIHDVKYKIENGEIAPDRYPEKEQRRDIAVTYVQTAVNYAKLYGPAVTLGMASIACIVGGHDIMKKRNVALVAAYKAVEESFNSYRKRVIEEYGEDKDYMFKHNLHAESVTETEIGEDGKSHKVKKTKLVADGDNHNYSQYAKWFDESCEEWSKAPEYNLMFLRSQQNYFNDLLKAKGHVFLNEVYDALGIPRTKAGAVVGWVCGKGQGDGFIDFGVFDSDKMNSRDFINGYERSILLDFNVDGLIYDLIEED